LNTQVVGINYHTEIEGTLCVTVITKLALPNIIVIISYF